MVIRLVITNPPDVHTITSYLIKRNKKQHTNCTYGLRNIMDQKCGTNLRTFHSFPRIIKNGILRNFSRICTIEKIFRQHDIYCYTKQNLSLSEQYKIRMQNRSIFLKICGMELLGQTHSFRNRLFFWFRNNRSDRATRSLCTRKEL